MKKIIKMLMPFLNKRDIIKCILLGLLAGLFNFLCINMITKIVNLVVDNKLNIVSKELLIIFFIIVILYIWTKNELSRKTIVISQSLFWNLRLDILKLILKSNYSEFYQRKLKIHSSIVSDVNTLTQVSLTAVDFCLSIVFIIACLSYMCFLSAKLFFVTFCILIIGSIIYLISLKDNNRNFEKVRELENGFMDYFTSMMNGYKEIYVDPRKGNFIYNNLIFGISKKAYSHNVTAFSRLLNVQLVGNIVSYILIGMFLLVFSVIFQLNASTVVSFVFVLLYLMSSLDTLMILIPSFLRAKVAANHILTLKNEMETANPRVLDHFENNREFKNISIQNLTYTYYNENNVFGIGPVNLVINKGEIIFIYGSNGSGKTTFVYLLLGLLKPEKGSVSFNEKQITHFENLSYINNFAVVFSDYYLFNFSIDSIVFDQKKSEVLLKLFELDKKVSLIDNKFSAYNLSTGQRKRLALISVILENKPILVLDEWAADQDPDFRRKFYIIIIPEIKKMGITIIAITHDDKYYLCADKLYIMEDGVLQKVKVETKETFIN